MEIKVKKPTYKELAIYLGVSEQAVKQYPKDKRYLMILGLMKINENKINEDDKNIISLKD